MNDDRFEQDLRSLLSRAAPAEVPAGFREQVIGPPFRRPRVTWTACSSPRWTLCNTVCRATPSRG